MAAEPGVRVLHLISTLDVGGAEMNLLRLVQGISKGYESHVVSLTSIGPLGKRIRDLGIGVEALGMKKGLPDPRGVIRLARIVRRFDPHVIQCWMYHANLLGLVVSGRRPLVWNIRCSDMDLRGYGRIYRWAVKAGALFSPLPDAVVANSLAGKNFHGSLGYSPRTWTVIPNGFDTAVYRPDEPSRRSVRKRLGIPDAAPVIGLTNRYDLMKDHATFFRAASLLSGTGASVHFILAGRGVSEDNPALSSLLGTMPHVRHVHLLGERQDVPGLINAFDIAASSSSYGEGLPNAIGEAMATAVPCVVTDVGDSAALVDDTGIVVSKKDPQALCAAWQSLLDAGPDFRKAMGIRARKRIIEHYSLQSMISRYEALYRDLTTGPES
jgi:glycosyltransferase involved in cell wall biosynthesis